VATKADFTEEEWKALQKGVSGAGMLVSVGDRDFTDSFGEASALAKTLAAQQEQGTSELVREIANIRGTQFGLTASQEEIESETFASLEVGLAALAAKAPEDVAHYRQLVLGAAEAVAEAKGGVKSGEMAALDKIKEALGS
jgi:hypothetical protein